jgi:hypothetical protein
MHRRSRQSGKERRAERDHVLLRATPSEEVYRIAYGIYGSQFEDVIAKPYYEAINALPDDERPHLLTLTAQGADKGFFTDAILHELPQPRDSRILPAFDRWTRYPDSQSFQPQESIAYYSLAMQGWAYLQAAPPQQPTPATDDEAWHCYGQLIFGLRRPGLDRRQVTELHAPVWNRLLEPLSLAAVDPLYRLPMRGAYHHPKNRKRIRTLMD